MCHWIRQADVERGRTALPSIEAGLPGPRSLVGALAAVVAVAVPTDPLIYRFWT